MGKRPIRQKGAHGRAEARQAWSALLRKLWSAEAAQQSALASFTSAERRFFALPPRQRRSSPSWYRAAEQATFDAGEALDTLYCRIAATPSLEKQGLRAKVRLLAMAYGVALDMPVRRRDREDLCATLIRSVFADLTRKSAEKP